MTAIGGSTGWAELEGTAAIPDVTLDPRVPLAFYRHRGVTSVAMARVAGDAAALVAAWSAPHLAGARQLAALAGYADVLATVREASPRAEERLRLAFEAAQIGTWDWDIAAERLSWDERCREIFGVGATEVVDPSTFASRIHPEDRERLLELVRTTLDGAGGGDFRAEYRTIDGRWVEGRGRAHFDTAGRAVRFVGTAIDVTRARRTAELLRASEAQWRVFADSLPQLVLSTDPHGHGDYFNQQWREHTGLTDRESRDEGWRRVVHAEDLGGLLARWTEGIATGTPIEAEARFRRARDGAYRWLLWRALPVRDAAGSVMRWLATGTDIHTQKEAERAMAVAVQVRDDFLAVAGHELRTPLTALHLQLQGVARLVDDPSPDRLAKVDERMARCVASCERLTILVDQLLDVSRMTSGRITLDLQVVDLAEVARDSLARFEESARGAGCELRLTATGGVRGLWDRPRVDQIITNLVANAVKYGAGKPVEVAAVLQEEHAVLTVRDHGIGIDLVHQARIFGRFERAVSEERFSGFGLGLWIVHRIVEALGGKILVHSSPGLGAAFEVRLPRGPVR